MAELRSVHPSVITELIGRALQEDIQDGDVTTESIVDEDVQARAIWKTKEPGVVAGLDVARQVFQSIDETLTWDAQYEDGDKVGDGVCIVNIEGSCRAILTAERTALNIAQRMSGIATKTHKFAHALQGFSTRILDTRKTVPGLRHLDKYAVQAGGGTNHRMGLYDMAMIKDNHIVAAGGISNAINRVRQHSSDLRIEVETTNLDQVEQALAEKADIIMLDNMDIDLMEKAVSLINKKAETEASGNINYKDLRKVAATGVDFISAGALTHTVKAFDISQQIQQIYHQT